MITAESLRKLCVRLSDEDAEKHAAALEKARQQSTVNTARRLAHLMGQAVCRMRWLFQTRILFGRPERN
jgi:hypothetical protein